MLKSGIKVGYYLVMYNVGEVSSMLFWESLFFGSLEDYSIYIAELDGTSDVPDPNIKSKSRALYGIIE